MCNVTAVSRSVDAGTHNWPPGRILQGICSSVPLPPPSVRTPNHHTLKGLVFPPANLYQIRLRSPGRPAALRIINQRRLTKAGSIFHQRRAERPGGLGPQLLRRSKHSPVGLTRNKTRTVYSALRWRGAASLSVTLVASHLGNEEARIGRCVCGSRPCWPGDSGAPAAPRAPAPCFGCRQSPPSGAACPCNVPRL